MSLYLVQHGKAFPEEIDPSRPLTEEGKEEVERIACFAARSSLFVSQILHSGKLRAKQTAELLAKHLNPPLGLTEKKGLGPNDDVRKLSIIREVTQNIMIVGHLPFLGKLVSYLILDNPDKEIIQFQNGGIVCLDINPNSGSWYIKWVITPELSI